MTRKSKFKTRRAKAPNPKTAKPAPSAKVKAKRAKQSARRKLPPAAPLSPDTEQGADGRTWYSDDERKLLLAALAANAGNVNKTAREQGVPYMTLYTWSRGWRCPRALQLYEDKKHDLARAAHEIAWQMAAELPEDAAEAKFRDKVICFGTMIDKMLILVGKPNNIIAEHAVPAQVSAVGRILEVVNGLPENERTTIARFLSAVRSGGSVEVPDRGSGGRAGGVEPPEARREEPRALPAFLT